MRFLRLLLAAAAACALPAAAPAADAGRVEPLQGPYTVSGTFGEYRANHFHSGLDLSTHGRVGVPVCSLEDGVVERVHVSQGGYGRALYVRGADGTRRVYAHLSGFLPEIEKTIPGLQRKADSYELDFSPSPEVRVRRGQVIAYSGFSGTTAPHLHVEMRDARGEALDITPLLPVHLAGAPQFHALVLMPLSPASRVDGRAAPLWLKVSNAGGRWRAERDAVPFSGYLGVAADLDQDNAGNRLGVREAALWVGGRRVRAYAFDRLDFDRSKSVEDLFDRRFWMRSRRGLLRLFGQGGDGPLFVREAGGPARGVLASFPAREAVALPPGTAVDCRVEATGFDGRTSVLEFSLLAGGRVDDAVPPARLPAGGALESADGLLCVELKTPLCVYEALKPALAAEGQGVSGAGLKPVGVAYALTPGWAAADGVDLVFRLPGGAGPHPERLAVYERKAAGWSYAGGAVEADGHALRARVRYFGRYGLAVDDQPPKATLLLRPMAAGERAFRVRVTDLGSGVDAGATALTVDGVKLFPYLNHRTGAYELTLASGLAAGRHRATLEARDRAGNRLRQDMDFELHGPPAKPAPRS